MIFTSKDPEEGNVLEMQAECFFLGGGGGGLNTKTTRGILEYEQDNSKKPLRV